MTRFLEIPTLNARRAEQGARANDHIRHVSCSEQHEPRRLRTWLILNVGRNMHLRVVIIAGFVALLGAGCASVDRFAEFRRYEKEANGRFLGVLGFALSVPGVEDFERHYSYSSDVFVIPKTSDYFGS